MSFKTTCPECGRQYKLADSSRGKTLRCKECGETFTAGGRRRPTRTTADRNPRREPQRQAPAGPRRGRPPRKRSANRGAQRSPGRSILQETFEGDGPNIIKILLCALIGSAKATVAIGKGGGSGGDMAIAAVAGCVLGGICGWMLTISDKMKANGNKAGAMALMGGVIFVVTVAVVIAVVVIVGG